MSLTRLIFRWMPGLAEDQLTPDEQDLIRAAAGYRGDQFVEHFFVIHPQDGQVVVYQPPTEESTQ